MKKYTDIEKLLFENLNAIIEYTKGSKNLEEAKENLRKSGFEDDAIERRAHRPTVIMHSSTDTEEAIILNGAENRLAAGGGLRELRYLRKDNKD